MEKRFSIWNEKKKTVQTTDAIGIKTKHDETETKKIENHFHI